MNRALTCSATLLTLPLLVLFSGCGGEKPSEAPRATTTTVAASAVTTTTAATGKTEEEAAPLLAWADADPEEGQAPLTVQFKADVEGGSPPLKYTWSFGDGTPDSNEANPKHIYQKAGKFRADLTVADGGGDSDSDYIEIEAH